MTGGALRERLRSETSDFHARLHRHPGLSAAASGRIDIDAYRLLLMRLYGFHSAFEASLGDFVRLEEAPSRSELLASDLAALGVARKGRDALPLCRALAPVSNCVEALGALYVVEGSALGGAGIARALRKTLLAPDAPGCRFFSNDGFPRRVWADLLTRLAAIHDPREESAAIASALATFRAFETWMVDWDSSRAALAAP